MTQSIERVRTQGDRRHFLLEAKEKAATGLWLVIDCHYAISLSLARNHPARPVHVDASTPRHIGSALVPGL